MKIIKAFIVWFTIRETTYVFELHSNNTGLFYGSSPIGKILDIWFLTIAVEPTRITEILSLHGERSHKGYSFLELVDYGPEYH